MRGREVEDGTGQIEGTEIRAKGKGKGCSQVHRVRQGEGQ